MFFLERYSIFLFLCVSIKFCAIPTRREDELENGQIQPQILKYNADGELVTRYQLDKIAMGIAIDDNEATVYAISFDKISERIMLKIKL